VLGLWLGIGLGLGLRLGFGLGLDLVSGWLVVMHTYLYYFALSSYPTRMAIFRSLHLLTAFHSCYSAVLTLRRGLNRVPTELK